MVKPVWVKAEYANILPLSLANGVFECDVERVWSDVYSFNRREVTPAKVAIVLESLATAGMLFRWLDKDTGKVWGYWTGIDKPGRLPGESRRGINEAVGPQPPKNELDAYVDSSRKHLEVFGIQNLLGFGFGTGSGFGRGSGLGAETKSTAASAGELPLAFTGRVLRITAELHEQLQSVYQALNLADHYAEADLWLVTHPEKPRKNQPAFVTNWLKKAETEIGKTLVRVGVGVGPSRSDVRVKLKPHMLERLERERASRNEKYEYETD